MRRGRPAAGSSASSPAAAACSELCMHAQRAHSHAHHSARIMRIMLHMISINEEQLGKLVKSTFSAVIPPPVTANTATQPVSTTPVTQPATFTTATTTSDGTVVKELFTMRPKRVWKSPARALDRAYGPRYLANQ